MRSVSELFKELYENGCKTEVKANIAGTDYFMDSLVSMRTVRKVFSEDSPVLGACVAGELSLELIAPDTSIPRQAKIIPFVRLTDGSRFSEWLQKGVFYIDTRSTREDSTGAKILTIHSYDDMLKAEQDYPESSLDWPAADIDVVNEIARFIGVPVSAKTTDLIKNAYQVQYPAQYTCRETLGFIAAMYGGCFIMNDLGELELIVFAPVGNVTPDEPVEGGCLITEDGDYITFGGVRILV